MNSVSKYVSPWNRVETKRWVTTAPAFLIVCVTLPPDLYFFTGLRSLSSTLHSEGSPSLQAGLWWTRSALASLESSQVLSQFWRTVLPVTGFLFDKFFPPLYSEQSNTASKVSDEKFTNNLWFSAVFIEILFILLVTSELLVSTSSMSQTLQVWFWPLQNSEAALNWVTWTFWCM